MGLKYFKYSRWVMALLDYFVLIKETGNYFKLFFCISTVRIWFFVLFATPKKSTDNSFRVFFGKKEWGGI